MPTSQWTARTRASGAQTAQVKGRPDKAGVGQQRQTRVFTGGEFIPTENSL